MTLSTYDADDFWMLLHRTTFSNPKYSHLIPASIKTRQDISILWRLFSLHCTRPYSSTLWFQLTLSFLLNKNLRTVTMHTIEQKNTQVNIPNIRIHIIFKILKHSKFFYHTLHKSYFTLQSHDLLRLYKKFIFYFNTWNFTGKYFLKIFM